MTIRSISQVLEDFLSSLEGERVNVAAVVEALHERGLGFLVFLFAFPIALPLPVPPGFNIAVSTPLIFLTLQQAVGRHTVWLPAFILRWSFARARFEAIFRAALPWIRKIEGLTRPRLGFITQGVFSHIIGILGLIMAITVWIPFPLTNTVPSTGIAIMAIGVIGRDGLAVIIGALVGGLWVAMLGLAALFLGAEGIELVEKTITYIYHRSMT